MTKGSNNIRLVVPNKLRVIEFDPHAELGQVDLKNSTCFRTSYRNGNVVEFVYFRGNVNPNALGDEIEAWLDSHEIEHPMFALYSPI